MHSATLLKEDDLQQAFLEWFPECPYHPERPDDFPAFYDWFREAFAPVYAELSRFMPDNWMAVRERSRLAAQTQYWLAGVLSTAEAYLTAAECSATYIVEQDLGQNNKTEKLKDRQKSLCMKEQMLVTFIKRLLNALEVDINRMQTELRQYETEARLGALTAGT